MFRTKFLSVVLAGLLLMTPAMAQETAADDQSAATVKTTAVEQGVFSRTVQNVGTLHFPITANITYEGPQGIFQDFMVRRGDYVEAGQVIATVMVEGSDINQTNAQLTLQRTQEAYEKGCEDYELRLQSAYQTLSTLPNGYEQEMQLLQIRLLESQYAQYCYQQEYSIQQQKEALGDQIPSNTVLEITAPISGIVEDLISTRSETFVNDKQVLGSIASLETVLLAVPNEAGSFRYGMDVTIATGSSKDPTYYDGRIIASDNVLPQAQRDQVAYVAIDIDLSAYPVSALQNIASALKNITVRGESVRIENAILLPRDAVTMESGKYFVTLYEDGMLKKRYVLAGDSNTQYTLVMVGVEPGDQIVGN